MVRSASLAAVAACLFVASLVVGARSSPPPCAFDRGPPGASPEGTASGPRAPKGPVGWEVFRRMDQLPLLSLGTQARMFSSADPAGGNADGFRGRYLCRAADGYVLGQHSGPGQLTSLWFTRSDGDVSANGDLRIEIDGDTVVDAPLQEVVDGRLGAPFVHPLVANAAQASGGVYIQVPMPFRHSMRVLTTREPHFHRVQYEVFADPAGVETFDPTDPARDVVRALRDAGTAPPAPVGPGHRRVRRAIRLSPGEASRPVRLDGPGQVAEIRLRLPGVATLPQPGTGRTSVGATEEVVRVDPANEGVRVVRHTRVRDAAQVAPVLVDEVEGPYAFSPLRPRPGGEFTQVLELPAAVTADRERVLLSDVRPGPATLVVRSRVDDGWVVTDRVQLDAPPPAPSVDPADPARALRGLRLQVRFDGRRTVDVPVAEAFGVGLGQRPVANLMFAVATDGTYRAWWPMPFARRASVRLVNRSGTPVSGDLQVLHEPGQAWADELGGGGRAGYFHASARAGRTRPGRDWQLAAVAGHGRLVGFTQTVTGRQPGRTYLEGDERLLVDGSRSPQLHGTGTEDLYLAGWYFNRGPFSTPFSGHSAHLDGLGDRCRFECDAMWRVLAADGIPFHGALRFRIEHGVDNGFEAVYASSAAWYERGEPAMRRTDALDVGDPRSERGHDYAGRGQVRRLTSRYPASPDADPVTDHLRDAHGQVRFRMAIDPDNAGVLLRRRADQAHGGQAVRVLVDGVEVGTWFQPRHNGVDRWRDDDLLLPASLTRGRATIEVTLLPLAAAPPWTAARYEAYALQGPVVDGRTGTAAPPAPADQ